MDKRINFAPCAAPFFVLLRQYLIVMLEEKYLSLVQARSL